MCSALLAMRSSTWCSEASAAVCSVGRVDRQAADGGQAVEQGGAGRGERHARHVVRDPGPQPDGRDAGLAEGELERAPHPRGHVDLALDDADLGHQVGRLAGGGGRQAHRPGVGGRGREGAQPDDHADPELARQRHHRGHERRPAEVGLGPDQVADVGAGAVGAHPHLDDGPGEALVDAVGDVHHGTAGALVDEGLAVEGGDELGRRRPTAAP